ncbi:lysophospholipid acyltransferase family protein [Rhodocyclus purpureus]|uniref:lysophospholipid acyltransferase family protein n=1 Tax=Rhodocyclus purpureus TaxID=1067 RepID=UPI001912F7E4|nr:lysophospholipid acyltransferase family protein [Rhodocyclus purpureus]MBK5914888.1 1-acyl-sn-glycerol-3-phosphate acyltransferase [Rhodocyclus purpureus]
MDRTEQTPLPLCAWRLLRLALHLLAGVATVATVYPLIDVRRRLALKQRWSRQLLAILGVRLDAQMVGTVAGSLFVANHISWLDIFALNAAHPLAFIAKAEVRQWPVIGWLAAKADTVFLLRGSRGHAKVVNAQIDALLDAERDIALFPEGTTTDGTHLLGFHAALLQPAISGGRPLQPVAISYHEADGRRSLAPAYVGETTLLECLWAIVKRRQLIVRIRATQVLPTAGGNRRELAHAARAAIADRLDLPREAEALAA